MMLFDDPATSRYTCTSRPDAGSNAWSGSELYCPGPGNETIGLRTAGGVVQAVSSEAARNAGFSYDGSEFLYGVYSNQHRGPFQTAGQAMSGWTASTELENGSGGSVTLPNRRVTSSSIRTLTGRRS